VRYFSTPPIHDCVRITVGLPEHTDRIVAALTEVLNPKQSARHMTNLPVPVIAAPLQRISGPRHNIDSEPISQLDYQLIKEAFPACFSTRRNGAALAYRYVLFTKVLRGTGLRLAEALRLEPQHLVRYGTDVYMAVVRGKKKDKTHEEEIALPPELAAELAAYIVGNGVKAGQQVFAFSPAYYESVFRAAAYRALGRRATPHSIRSLYIIHLIDAGVPVPDVSKSVGHADERTTMRHYPNLTREKRQAIARAIPL
jgi:integrase